MNVPLLKEFCLRIADPQSHANVAQIFDNMLTDPGMSAAAALKGLMTTADDPVAKLILAAQGKEPPKFPDMMVGFMMGLSVAFGSDSEIFIKFVQDFLKATSRAQGENVVDFTKAKFMKGTP